ncbi:hypothetical protein BC826DRAFT_916018, partial [Russula brevipes]
VLSDSGVVHFANAISFTKRCLGVRLGSPQAANLGGGNAWVNQIRSCEKTAVTSTTGACSASETIGRGKPSAYVAPEP